MRLIITLCALVLSILIGVESISIRNFGNRRYLDSNRLGKVTLSRKNHRYTRWIVHVTGDQDWILLQNEATDLALEAQNEIVFTSMLKGSDTQKWKFAGLNLINKATGMLLGSNKKREVYLTFEDEEDKFQKWLQLENKN